MQSCVRFMCSFGGRILPRPHDNQLRYVGGDTRIVAVHRTITFSSLLIKIAELSGTTDVAVKYQLPNEDLDALISVTTDEDVENMIEEYDRLTHSVNPKTARLRLFLFPLEADSDISSLASLLNCSSKREHWFFDQLNGRLERGRSEASSIISEVPDYLFGLDNSEEPREPKPRTRTGLADNVSVSDPGSPAPVASSPYCSTSSSNFMPSIPNLPPVKTEPVYINFHCSSMFNLFTLLMICLISIKNSGANHRSPALQVAHRHGPCSPLGKQEKTPSPHEILLLDQSRVRFMNSRLSNRTDAAAVGNSDVRVPARSGRSLGTGNFVVTIGLGTPKNDLSLVFDTGSDLTWTQCKPCAVSCYSQQEPIYDPSKSSSYSTVPCGTAECSQVSSATGRTQPCNASSQCNYAIRYGDGSFSIGIFARETLTFASSEVFPNFKFGCGQNNKGLFGSTAGLLGLGRDKLSFASQTAQKLGNVFSYCLPPSASSTGFLAVGDKVSSSVKYTPLVTDPREPSFYFLNLEGITVAQKRLPISASVFSSAGTIIDSGTVITRLPPSAYEALRSAFRQGMSKYPMAKPASLLDTCYNLTGYDTVEIPRIVLNFGGGADVEVDQTGILFVLDVSQVCLAFAGNTDAGDLGIIGNRQQQTLEVVHDVPGSRIGFGAGACSSS